MSVPQPRCRVTDEPIDAAALLAKLPSPEDGAVLLFLGVVRNHNEGRGVGSLEYQAYREMAERSLEQIVSEAEQRWETGAIRVVHRVGRLAIGEASVAIAVASPHREAAYEASRYVIEELKRRVPIWKREGYLDGASEWLGGSDPARAGEEAHG
jgi:molybdopterin synthase catalytic subunit